MRPSLVLCFNTLQILFLSAEHDRKTGMRWNLTVKLEEIVCFGVPRSINDNSKRRSTEDNLTKAKVKTLERMMCRNLKPANYTTTLHGSYTKKEDRVILVESGHVTGLDLTRVASIMNRQKMNCKSCQSQARRLP